MSEYNDYLEALKSLYTSIDQADHARAASERSRRDELAQFEKSQQQATEKIQAQIHSLASEYIAVVKKVNAVSGSDLKLPERVRPVVDARPTNEALRQQHVAIRSLEEGIRAFEAAKKSEAASMNAAASALAARRAALAQSQTKQEPESVPRSGPAPIALAEKKGRWARLLDSLRRLFSGRSSEAREKRPAPAPKRSSAPLRQATERGFMSGYEPQALKDIVLTSTPLMFGTPGSGLSDSGFDDTAVKLGQRGEENFAKALSKSGLLPRFATFWSIHMLSKDTYSKEQSDVDCAIVTGHTIWLVDLKYYVGGNVAYEARGNDELVCIDVPTGQRIGNPRRMTKNMKMAIDRFQSRYQNYHRTFRLEARVVFIPTNSGVGRINGVRWPGGIPAVTLPDFLDELRAEPPFIETLDSDLVKRTFQGLVKI